MPSRDNRERAVRKYLLLKRRGYLTGTDLKGETRIRNALNKMPGVQQRRFQVVYALVGSAQPVSFREFLGLMGQKNFSFIQHLLLLLEEVGDEPFRKTHARRLVGPANWQKMRADGWAKPFSLPNFYILDYSEDDLEALPKVQELWDNLDSLTDEEFEALVAADVQRGAV